jgi:hypothetical protein
VTTATEFVWTKVPILGDSIVLLPYIVRPPQIRLRVRDAERLIEEIRNCKSELGHRSKKGVTS